MPNYRKIIVLHEQGVSQRQIAKLTHSSRDVIRRIIKSAENTGMTAQMINDLTDAEIAKFLGLSFSEKGSPDPLYEMPDYDYYSKELKKPGVTITLLWEEYVSQCKRSGKLPYQKTQFGKYFRDHIRESEFTDIIRHKPGESIEVDWAGTRPYWFDPDTGEKIEGYLFVGVLSYSGYGYAEVTADMKEESWINAHIHMFDYFNGITRFLIPDNLKTGVTKHPKDEEAVLNQRYQEMADHYGIAVIPARVRHPKDKPMAESLVGKYTTQIIARLRNNKFFSAEEYNKACREEVKRVNNKPFQKKPGSRSERFLQEEKEYLRPLPVYPYEYAVWKKAKVQANSHISYDKRFYSVPYEYIGHEVDLRITRSALAVYYKDKKICTHPVLKARDGAYSTNPEHMPKGSNAREPWNKDRFIKRANRIGIDTTTVITELFTQYSHEQQAYNGAKSILLLADSYSPQRLEKACSIALKHLSRVRFRDIKGILKNNHDLEDEDLQQTPDHQTGEVPSPYLRGPGYYGGKKNG